MCCRKCKCLESFIFNYLLPYSILCIFLLQIYAQYSTIVTQRTKIDNKRDGRNTMSNYKFFWNKEYDFNMNKVQQSFEENALMNMQFLRKPILGLFELINNKKESKFDIRTYMFFYLILYDFICLIIVYLFIYGSIKCGIVKIIFQLIRMHFNCKRMRQFNSQMSLVSIIKSKIENIYLREWNFFNPEGFLIIELLCNLIIILDIILLVYYIYEKKKIRRIKIMNEGIEDKELSLEEEPDDNNNIIKNDDENSKDNDENNNIENNNNIKRNNIKNNNNLEGSMGDPFKDEEENEEISEESDHNNNEQETKE